MPGVGHITWFIVGTADCYLTGKLQIEGFARFLPTMRGRHYLAPSLDKATGLQANLSQICTGSER